MRRLPALGAVMAIVAASVLTLAPPARAVMAPTITTQASTPFPGGPLSDTATLSGGSNPTGPITFNLYGPNNPSCAGPPIFTSTVVVVGTGSVTSGSFTLSSSGTYRWVATYFGDANNLPAGPTVCGDPDETVTIVWDSFTRITTQASIPSPGGTMSDTGTLSGGSNPTGTVTFTLYGPNDATCAGPPAFSSAVPIAGNGVYTSGSFTPTAPGTYRWVASYSGDANNQPVGPTACGDPAETVVVPAPPHGFLTICKAKKGGDSGTFAFTVEAKTVTVAAGQCSSSIRLPVGEVTVTEAPTIGFRLAECTTTPAGRLVACDRNAGSAVVHIAGGGIANQAIATFRNRRASGELKICKVAGHGVAPGSPTSSWSTAGGWL